VKLRLNIQTRLFLTIIGILFFFALVIFIIQNLSFKIHNDILSDAISGTLHLYTINFEKLLDDIKRQSFTIVTNIDLQNKIKKTREFNLSSFEQYNNKKEIIDYLEFSFLTEDSIDAISLVDTNDNQYTVKAELFNFTKEQISHFRKRAIEMQGNPVWLNHKDSRQNLFLVREIREIEGSFLNHLGTLIIKINMKKIMEIAKGGIDQYDIIISLFSRNNLLYITDNKIKIENIYKKYKDKKHGYVIDRIDNATFLATFLKSKKFDWIYVSLLPYNIIIEKINILSNSILIFYVIIFILIIFLFRKVTRSITKPIMSLAKEMKRIEELNFSITQKALKKYLKGDEIGILYREFDLMLEKINNLVKENYEKQIILKETQLKMLQTQINPHFLYNTFDSINWLARINKQRKIAIMINSLAHLLRDSINNSEKIITINKEVELLESYIAIQKIRYNELLDIHINISNTIKKYAIPKLVLQPIVENSIKYGLEKTGEPCLIEVKGYKHKKRIHIIITDNGPGINEETLKKIQEGNIDREKSGIGLKNIYDRLIIIYKENFVFLVTSKTGKGTEIMIKLPILTVNDFKEQ